MTDSIAPAPKQVHTLRMYRRVGWAWLALCFALALHVWDEAAHDFLAVYNPNAAAIRASLPWLPVPQFTYTEWRNGLIVAACAVGVAVPRKARNARSGNDLCSHHDRERMRAHHWFAVDGTMDAGSVFGPAADRVRSVVVCQRASLGRALVARLARKNGVSIGS